MSSELTDCGVCFMRPDGTCENVDNCVCHTDKVIRDRSKVYQIWHALELIYRTFCRVDAKAIKSQRDCLLESLRLAEEKIPNRVFCRESKVVYDHSEKSFPTEVSDYHHKEVKEACSKLIGIIGQLSDLHPNAINAERQELTNMIVSIRNVIESA